MRRELCRCEKVRRSDELGRYLRRLEWSPCRYCGIIGKYPANTCTCERCYIIRNTQGKKRLKHALLIFDKKMAKLEEAEKN
jgi:hypothetical protein